MPINVIVDIAALGLILTGFVALKSTALVAFEALLVTKKPINKGKRI